MRNPPTSLCSTWHHGMLWLCETLGRLSFSQSSRFLQQEPIVLQAAFNMAANTLRACDVKVAVQFRSQTASKCPSGKVSETWSFIYIFGQRTKTNQNKINCTKVNLFHFSPPESIILAIRMFLLYLGRVSTSQGIWDTPISLSLS